MRSVFPDIRRHRNGNFGLGCLLHVAQSQRYAVPRKSSVIWILDRNGSWSTVARIRDRQDRSAARDCSLLPLRCRPGDLVRSVGLAGVLGDPHDLLGLCDGSVVSLRYRRFDTAATWRIAHRIRFFRVIARTSWRRFSPFRYWSCHTEHGYRHLSICYSITDRPGACGLDSICKAASNGVYGVSCPF